MTPEQEKELEHLKERMETLNREKEKQKAIADYKELEEIHCRMYGRCIRCEG